MMLFRLNNDYILCVVSLIFFISACGNIVG